MLEFKAAIFDLDGTILDSMDVWEKIDIEFLAKRNLNVPKNYIDAICSRSFREAAEYTIKLFNLDDSPDDLMKEWNNMALHEYSHNIKLKPHAKEYLELLKSCDIKLSTATALPRKLSDPVLKNTGIFQLFDAQCSADEVSYGKKHPDIFLLASQKLGIPPRQCLVFEDLLDGIISAKKAGMFAFGIYDKVSGKHEADIRKIADGYLFNFRYAPKPQNIVDSAFPLDSKNFM